MSSEIPETRPRRFWLRADFIGLAGIILVVVTIWGWRDFQSRRIVLTIWNMRGRVEDERHRRWRISDAEAANVWLFHTGVNDRWLTYLRHLPKL